MGKRLVYTDASGNCCVVHPAYSDQTRPKGETEKALLARVAAKAIPEGIIYSVILETSVPIDRTFRNAWEADSKGHPKVSIEKARIIHMDHIRLVRDAELSKLDVPFMRAVESGDAAEQTRLARLKQTLRDIPQTFDLGVFSTPETLKDAWPAELPTQ